MPNRSLATRVGEIIEFVHVVHVMHVFEGEQARHNEGYAPQLVVGASAIGARGPTPKGKRTMKLTPEQWDGLFRLLNDGGCPVQRNHGYKISPIGLSIEEMPVMSFSEIFDLPDGGAGYAFEAVVRNDASRAIDIQGFQIKFPWGIPRVSLVPAPKKSSTRYPNYTFPGVSRYYDGDFVLNPIFARRNYRMNPGEEVEGVLVASSEESIPLEVRHNALIFARISVFDSRRNTFSGQFRVRVNRERITREREQNDKSRGAASRTRPA
jgi:hypothetical protein